MDLDHYNVVWDSPSKSSYGSMPIGNGDIGLNVWAEPDRGLLFYIGKTDAWSENGRLLKLGRVRVGISPTPFAKGQPFRQTLDLANAEIRIEAGEGERRVTLRIWVDANHPVIHVDAESASAVEMQDAGHRQAAVFLAVFDAHVDADELRPDDAIDICSHVKARTGR